jgi:hypothetical protein
VASLICLNSKNKLTNLPEIQAHNQQENPSDKLVFAPEHSRLNYRLHRFVGHPSLVKLEYELEYKNILKKCYKGQRTVRKDATVLCSMFVTSNKSFFEVQEEAKIRSFFECNFSFLKDYFGEDLVVDAVVHMDERIPHMHFCFVPLTKDGRLSAKEIFDRKGLTLLHAKALASIRKNGFDITKSDDVYKPLKMAEDLKRNILLKEVQKLETKLQDYKSIDASVKSIDDIPFKRSKLPFRSEMVALTDENFSKMRGIARFGAVAQHEFEKLKKENVHLRKRYDDHVILINDLREQVSELIKNRDELLREGMEMLQVVRSSKELSELFDQARQAGSAAGVRTKPCVNR